jgi:DNA-directed RNA polymerase specialized sigma24 family protein
MASVTYLISQFKQGNSAAFGVLFGRFFAYPTGLARRRLRGECPIPLEGEDIAQLVFWELHRAVRQDRSIGNLLCDTRSLLVALASLTRQQVRRQWRDHTRQCRDVQKTRLAIDLPARGDTEPFDRVFDTATFRWLHEIESKETIAQLLVLLPSAKYRTVVQLLIQGHGLQEIALALDRSLRAIQRYLVEIQAIWRSRPAGQAILSQFLRLPAAGEGLTCGVGISLIAPSGAVMR